MSAHRLLSVEDNEEVAKIICRAAAEIGFDSCSAAGRAAMGIYHSFQPHVVVLDILMPEMDGIEFMQFLKKQPTIPRLVIASGSGYEGRRMAETLGTASGLHIDANISKPFRVHEMQEILMKIKDSMPIPHSLQA